MSNSLAENLKHNMRTKGINARELARKSAVKPSFIYDILKGKSRNPSGIKLAKIAESLNTDLRSLLQESEADHIARSQKTDAITSCISNHTSGTVMLPELCVFGKENDREVITQYNSQPPIEFSLQWITQHLRIDLAYLSYWHMQSDAMTPSLYPGDILLIDQSHITPYPAGIFLLFDGYTLLPRRLETRKSSPNTIVNVGADNTYYQCYECALSDISIIGRVVWSGHIVS